jgi:hypothetical protein
MRIRSLTGTVVRCDGCTKPIVGGCKVKVVNGKYIRLCYDCVDVLTTRMDNKQKGETV